MRLNVKWDGEIGTLYSNGEIGTLYSTGECPNGCPSLPVKEPSRQGLVNTPCKMLEYLNWLGPPFLAPPQEIPLNDGTIWCVILAEEREKEKENEEEKEEILSSSFRYDCVTPVLSFSFFSHLHVLCSSTFASLFLRSVVVHGGRKQGRQEDQSGRVVISPPRSLPRGAFAQQ